MVTSFGCSCVDGLGAAQNPSPWRCCKVRGKIGEGRIDGRGIVMDMERGMGMLSCMRGRYWSVGLCLGGREMLSCMREGISVCVVGWC